MKFVFKNAKGEEVVLNELEQYRADAQRRKIQNDLGMDINTTALTTILKSVIEQKYYEVAPSLFMDIVTGEGAWSQILTTYQSYQLGPDFEDGLVNSGTSDNGKIAMADAGVDAVNVNVFSWAKGISWNIMQLQEALKAGNWGLVEAKERARKQNYDLGIQKLMFLGLTNNSRALGLLNQSSVTANTTLIPTPIYQMSPDDYKLFTQKILTAFRTNCAKTAWCNTFQIPEPEWLGLTGIASTVFPDKSMLDVLIQCLRVGTGNPNFEVKPLVYGDKNYNNLSKNVYTLYNRNVDTLRANVPVPYTSTLANTNDNFTFQNAAYSQFTGLQVYRSTEMLYFTNTYDFNT